MLLLLKKLLLKHNWLFNYNSKKGSDSLRITPFSISEMSIIYFRSILKPNTARSIFRAV